MSGVDLLPGTKNHIVEVASRVARARGGLRRRPCVGPKKCTDAADAADAGGRRRGVPTQPTQPTQGADAGFLQGTFGGAGTKIFHVFQTHT